ncbi:Spo0E family sporulation regulatory protein-aspartic acid phosphatase [Paenibacillus frigoriresistens]|uniref:Spo0E family sporulation regulatory protein-aspartic acid phosphatase n=1 Tax=Paenibacillus alginolyticus TaxID=59839 RepID=UPI001564BA2D|nr:Spo0E family sporulation regulatory protein-aspartic acid phosphatase [Paenibacillus frigoriresistens]NRF95775.1 Spo0E family sporulation regulatory protein-aspartic acid phosphatase [Paenibacillus frigoriresistens]
MDDDLNFFLDKQIDIYKKMLANKVHKHNLNLQHPDVIALSQSLDFLIVRYWNLILDNRKMQMKESLNETYV